MQNKILKLNEKLTIKIIKIYNRKFENIVTFKLKIIMGKRAKLPEDFQHFNKSQVNFSLQLIYFYVPDFFGGVTDNR